MWISGLVIRNHCGTYGIENCKFEDYVFIVNIINFEIKQVLQKHFDDIFVLYNPLSSLSTNLSFYLL